MKTFTFCLIVLVPTFCFAQNSGCTDPNAYNFNGSATINDGSCLYNKTFYMPQKLGALPTEVQETSGAVLYNGILWTHNDSGGEAVLYGIDPITRGVLKKVVISSAQAVDWEDITTDDTYLYIGDFGNNNGNRRNLKIYKIFLTDLDKDTASAKSIQFKYEDQTDFSELPQNNNYDAEALISLGDSLYIFSKNWRNLQSRIYSLPKTEGTYVAKWIGEFNPSGLITGADKLENSSVIALTGYDKILQPFLYFLWDYENASFASGNKRKINLNLPFHQIEACTWINKSQLYLTNEKLKTIPATLFEASVLDWIDTTENVITKVPLYTTYEEDKIHIFPNPAKAWAQVEWEPTWNIQSIEIMDMSAKNSEVWLPASTSHQKIDVSNYSSGMYMLLLRSAHKTYCKNLIIQ